MWEKSIDGVSDPISRTTLEEGIVGIEDLPGDDDVPLSTILQPLDPPRL